MMRSKNSLTSPMTFQYLVIAEIERTNARDDAAYSHHTYTNLFSDEDPFKARKKAFKRAESYKDIFEEADTKKVDSFFKPNEGEYAEYNISVYFIDPKTKKEIEIHNTISSYINQWLFKGSEIYDPVTRKQISTALKKEYKILTKHGVPKQKKSFFSTPYSSCL